MTKTHKPCGFKDPFFFMVHGYFVDGEPKVVMLYDYAGEHGLHNYTHVDKAIDAIAWRTRKHQRDERGGA